MLKKIVCLVVPLVAIPLAVNAAEIQLPKTGQTVCYDAAGNRLESCAGTGQDAERQLGVAIPSPRFIDNDDGTVTDNLTGLVWLRNAGCFLERSWDQAFTDAAALNSGECGLTDNSTEGQWRLPNVKELQSLLDISGTTFEGTGSVFPNLEASYWSSTTHATFAENAWVTMYDGRVLGAPKATAQFSVWPVRNAQ